jgi:solute carrier family 13 (sodium-dependent dicarboxylate transporter), member 2/3/5
MAKKIGLYLGPSLFILLMLAQPNSLSHEAWDVIRVTVWMLIWWISESVPIAVTSLLPVLLFPLLGVLTLEKAGAPYADKFVFLFLGGFILALAMEKWSLHRRIALNIIKHTGARADRIILGFMVATALLSMWISNTATTMMMLPIAASIIALLLSEGTERKGAKNFAVAMMLGIAYAANVGGIATLIGTPPNGVMASILNKNYGIQIDFVDWMMIGLPFSIVMLTLVYLVLVKLIYPNRIGHFSRATDVVMKEIKLLGKMNDAELAVLVVFIMTAGLWIFRVPLSGFPGLQNLSDTGIAIFSAILLFILPTKSGGDGKTRILEWDDTKRLPWGILLLFGGGMSLAAGFKSSGLIEVVATSFASISSSHIILIIVLLTVVSLFLTELMSNMALVSIFVPVVAAIAVGADASPLLFAVPVTIAASCAFMFPMSTPPNAIVFGSGYVKISQMARSGVVLNLVAIMATTLLCYFFLEWWIAKWS